MIQLSCVRTQSFRAQTSLDTPKSKPSQVGSKVDMGTLAIGAATGAAIVGAIAAHRISSLKKIKTDAKDSAVTQKVFADEILYKIEPKELEKTALYQSFQDSKKNIFEFVQEVEAPAKDVKEFLFGVTKSLEHSKAFVKEAISDPRKSQEITTKLVQKVGGSRNFAEWYFHNDGYQKAYEKHIVGFFERAKTPNDLIHQSPNWHYYKVVQKFGKDFSVGELPRQIGGIEKHRKMISSLLTGQEMPEGIKLIKKFDPGYSGKDVALVEAGNKKFVIKYHQNCEEYSPQLRAFNEQIMKNDETSWLGEYYLDKHKENEMMKSDSGFINAQIDYYLRSNNNQNSSYFHFYDNKTASTIYELTEGQPVDMQDVPILDVNRKMPDMNKLGIIYNDIKAD
ncbi:MAG: hypothetical protein PHE78_03930, partial [Candidatus Gastranaerophilales bacterium]|nr:hypothetical protein [Candidatus Gastranaerophilales bacterium]